MRHRLISIREPRQWEGALSGVPHLAAHRADYVAALNAEQKQDCFLYVAECPRGYMICPFAVRGEDSAPDIYSLYGDGGILGSGLAATDIIDSMRFLKDQGFVAAFLRISSLGPLLDLSVSGVKSAESNDMFIIDLDRTAQEIDQEIGKNNRRLLRRWYEKGGRICESSQEVLKNFFLENYPAFAQRKGVSGQYLFQHDTLSRLAHLESAYFIGAGFGEHPELVRLFLSTPFGADAFLEAQKGDCAAEHSRGIYRHAVTYFSELGIPSLNIGGGIQRGDNLAFFKKSFATIQVPYRALKMVLDKDLYAKRCMDAGVECDDSRYFPAYYAAYSVLGNV